MYKAIRYIGSKQKVLPFLEENLLSLLQPGDKFFDGFVGSGIVSQYVAEKHNVIVSGGDISKYSEILFNILNIFNQTNEKQIVELFKNYQKTKKIEGDIFHELSNGGTPITYKEKRNFYHAEAGKNIDTFRYFLKNEIKNKNITREQSKVMLFFLLAYACKVANTTSVFGAFLKTPPIYLDFNLEMVKKILKELEPLSKNSNKHIFYLGDVVNNIKNIPYQKVIYLDPPYSTRRYESNYHILSFISDLDFSKNEIKKDSKTAQPKVVSSNPFGKKRETEGIFISMIKESLKKCDILGISYNTDGIIKQDWMENFCKENNFNLETKKLEYKRFKSKNEIKNETKLEEILWIIKK